jgi:hypothetical protein
MGHDNVFSGGFREGMDAVWLAEVALTFVVMDFDDCSIIAASSSTYHLTQTKFMIFTNDSNPRHSRNRYDGKMSSPIMAHFLFPYCTGVKNSGLVGLVPSCHASSSLPFGNTLYAKMTGKIGNNKMGTRKRGGGGVLERGRR